MHKTSSRIQHKPLNDIEGFDESTHYGVCGYVLVAMASLILILFFPFSLIWSLKVVQEYERAVIFRLGRIKGRRAQGPGLFFLMPCVDTFIKVDLRTFTFNIPPQEILTRDSVTVVVDAVIYARIYDATMATVNIKDARGSTNLLGATTLRTMLGTVGLSEILSDRDRIDRDMQNTLDNATHYWGVKVERVEIKDVRLPIQMQRAMAAEAEAGRMARAKVISAEGEMKAARSIKQAADVLQESPASIQLRYLQTLHSISEEQNHTIVFPLPASLFQNAQTALPRLLGAGMQEQKIVQGTKGTESAEQPLVTVMDTEVNTPF
ncbi:stomatin-like [Mya arenaria]|uniref:stomatin-like n=1 Tax=Mya arenaria TaxID=6604 RepID=UPI0022E40F6F|nr:stomatin-like [Mya arenaria]XP_052790952.1 stomatin-like [Mya arenaria]